VSGPTFLNKKQLATELHLSTRSIERMMRSGEAPPFIRAGARKALFERSAVAEWAKARTYRSIAAEMAANVTAKERLNDHDP
jgi:predicted DNA-binding transcriptional regulator AlpA